MSALPEQVKALLEKNERFAEKYEGAPTMVQMRAAAKARSGGVMILTCLDPRCVPEQYFGPGLRAGVIRNAGGRATPDVLRSVLTIRSLMDPQALLVVHHTDCGMTHLSDEQIASEAKDRTPDAVEEIDGVGSFGCFTSEDYEATIKRDVLKLRAEKSLAGMQILGFSMDIADGVVHHLDV